MGVQQPCLLDNKLLVLEKPPPGHTERNKHYSDILYFELGTITGWTLSSHSWEGPVSVI